MAPCAPTQSLGALGPIGSLRSNRTLGARRALGALDTGYSLCPC